MTGNTVVTMHPDGTAYVHTGNDGETWQVDRIQLSKRISRSCAEARKVKWPEGSGHCPCLACVVTTAVLKEER